MKTSCTSLLQCCIVLLGVLALSRAGAATITVTTLADADPPATNGMCSLREALANATDDAATYPDCAAGDGNDVITFATNLFPVVPPRVATIQLAGELVAGKVGGTPHALAIRAPVDGAFATRVRLKASTVSPHRVMTANVTAEPFSLSAITIEGGRTTGDGGGLRLISSAADLQGVTFVDNQADTRGGALAFAGTDGSIDLNAALFEGNVARFGAAIGIWNARSTEVRIANSVFRDNETSGSGTGGAINFEMQLLLDGDWMPALEITGSTFTGNRTTGQGGGINFRPGEGSNQRFRVAVTDSLFRSNQGGVGGGLHVWGTHMGSSPVARSGGSVTLRNNSFIENHAIRGGAASIRNADLVVQNTLFSSNTTSYRGAALHYETDRVTLPRSVALIGNTFHDSRFLNPFANPGGRTLWVVTEHNDDVASWHMAGNLVAPAAGTLPAGQKECQHADGSFAGMQLGGGDNLSPVADCLLLGADDLQANPMVSVIDSGNARHPRWVLPQPDSPAVDAWPADACTDDLEQPLEHDLRGEPRPTDGDGSGVPDCDIGAFELPGFLSDRIHADGFE